MLGIVMDGDGPLDGVSPDFGIFGGEFQGLWQQLLAGVWALAIVVVVGWLILAIVKFAGAKRESQVHNVAEARTGIFYAGGALLLLSVLPLLVSAMQSLGG